MKKHFCEQGSMEWYQLKIGVPSSSNFHKIVTPGGKPSGQADGYMYRLIAERLLAESFDSDIHVEAIERGRENEPYAASQFEYAYNVELEKIGFITTDDGLLGCSPDRLIKGKAESVEIKCPMPWTQIGRLLDGLDNDYKPQVQGHLLIGEFDAVHFYSWNPRMPPFRLVTHPDVKFQKIMAQLLHDFVEELALKTDTARALGAYVRTTAYTTPFDEHIGRPNPLEIHLP